MNPDTARYFADVHRRREQRHTHTIAIKDGEATLSSVTVELPPGMRCIDLVVDGKHIIGVHLGLPLPYKAVTPPVVAA